jgi:hypothetical protein
MMTVNFKVENPDQPEIEQETPHPDETGNEVNE